MKGSLLSAAALSGTLALAGTAFAATAASNWYGGPVYDGAPALPVTVAFVEAGGGPSHFEFSKALVSMLGAKTVKAEVKKLDHEYGAENVHTFLTGMTFAVNDALQRVEQEKIKLPPAADLHGTKLALTLVKAGTAPDGTFWAGYLFDHALTHKLHDQVMVDVDTKVSAKADMTTHYILNQAMFDVAQALGDHDVKLAANHVVAKVPSNWYGGPVYDGAPALPVTVAFVEAGGGPSHFEFSKALVSMLGAKTVKAEVKKLKHEYGAKNVHTFLTGMTFAVNDALQRVEQEKIKLPPAADLHGTKLALTLVKAGTAPDGTFWAGYLFDHALSHKLHDQVMLDIDKKVSAKADMTTHYILNQAMFDVAQALGDHDVQLAANHVVAKAPSGGWFSWL